LFNLFIIGAIALFCYVLLVLLLGHLLIALSSRRCWPTPSSCRRPSSWSHCPCYCWP
jgi:hypothetical protein